MTNRYRLAAVLGIGLMSAAANARGVDQRHADQARRIDNGIASGRLTRGEAYRDERQQASIDNQEARMRARNGGHLDAFQRGHLQQRENNASRHIYNASTTSAVADRHSRSVTETAASKGAALSYPAATESRLPRVEGG